MSRRKQSNPKPIKRQLDCDPEEFAKEVNLPSDILVLKKNDDQSDFSICTRIPLPKGSSFGPFKVSEVEGEVESENIMTVPGPGGKEMTILIETEGGYWLRLVNTVLEEKPADANTVISIQGDEMFCEVMRDIAEDAELVANVTWEEAAPEDEEDAPVEVVKEVVTGIPVPEATPAQHPLIFGCPHCSVRFSNPRTLQGHMTYYCSKRPSVPVETPGVESTNQLSPGSRKRMASTENEEDDSSPGRKRSRQLSSGSSHERTSPMLSPGAASKQHSMASPLPESEISINGRQRTYSGSSADIGCEMTRKVYKCPQCAYSADKKNSLHSHMRNMHKTAKDGTTEGGKIDDLITAPDMYCADCKIQFTSPKTYQGHKEFYCGKRMKQAIPEDFDEADAGRSGSSTDGQSPINPILSPPMSGPVMIPGCLTANGQPTMTIPGSLAAQPTVVFTGPIMTAPGPAGIALTMPTVIMQPLFLPSSLGHGHVALSSAMGAPVEEKPLDLTIRKDSTGSKHDEETAMSASTSGADSPANDHDTPTDLTIKKPRRDRASTDSRDDSNHAQSVSSADRNSTESKSPYIPVTVDMRATGAVSLPHNLSICSECNIVFYKHENFLIHKQFYCSGRKAKSQTVEEMETTKPATSSHKVDNARLSVESSKRRTPDGTSPTTNLSPPPSEHVLQFSCTPCKIKYSSLSTLEAHQRYYCPYRPQNPELGIPGSGTSVDNQTSDEDSNTAMPHVCQKCGNEYPTARLLKVHLCQKSNKPGIWNLLRCSQCSFVTHKESQFNDHVRKHSSVKGFRCSLCGYRGNTIRGMRMHGKMHVDKGETFTDDHMIVLDGDELPGKDDLANPIFSSDIESEIMRLKNEPYKRRRSRYKRRVEDGQNSHTESPKSDALFVCGLCNAPFTDCNDLGQHMQKHLESKPYKCSLCSYSSTMSSHLEKHVKVIHKVEMSPQNVSEDRTTPNIEIKEEPVDNSEDNSLENHVDVKRESELDFDPGTPKSESSAPPSPSKKKSHLVTSLLRKIKQEPQEISTNNENHCENDSHVKNDMSPIQVKAPLSPMNPPDTNSNVKDGLNAGHTIVNGAGKPNFRYCNHCDISFMYLSSFVAHKKYYCNASIIESVATEKEHVPEAK